MDVDALNPFQAMFSKAYQALATGKLAPPSTLLDNDRAYILRLKRCYQKGYSEGARRRSLYRLTGLPPDKTLTIQKKLSLIH